MTPFHPKLRQALLEDTEHRREIVFTLTEKSIKNLKLDEKTLKRLGIIKNIAFRGKKEFLTKIKETIDEKLYEEYKDAILENCQRISLTEEKLLEYEGMVTRLFYLERYYPQFTLSLKNQMLMDINNVREKYMPNFKKIYVKWIRDQNKAIKRNYFDLCPLKIIENSLILLWTWFKNLFILIKDWLLNIYFKRKDKFSVVKK